MANASSSASRPRLRIGTRGSPLALAQAEETRNRLITAHPDLAVPDAIEIVVIRTTGDAIQNRPLAEIGGKGLFTLEIEQALQSGDIDLAVHSMKDMPTDLPDGLHIAAILPREDVRDALILPVGQQARCLADIPAGTLVGTASLRRQAILLARRPDLSVVSLRGNVQTRLRKLAEGEIGATFLAMAGLNRLGLSAHATARLALDDMLPAVAQGAIGIETRIDDARVAAYVAPLDHADTHCAVRAERAMLKILDGSCRTPISGHAGLTPDGLALEGWIALPDGTALVCEKLTGPANAPDALGRQLGHVLRGKADPRCFQPH